MTGKVVKTSDLISKAAVRWSLVAIFLINSLITLTVAFNSLGNDKQIRVNTEQMAVTQTRAERNTALLQKALLTQCTDRNIAALNTNGIIDSLMKSPVLNTLSAADRKERLQLYTSAKVPIINCAIDAVPSQYQITERPASTMAPELVVMVTS